MNAFKRSTTHASKLTDGSLPAQRIAAHVWRVRRKSEQRESEQRESERL